MIRDGDLELQPWTEGDLAMLLADDTPEMTAHLGGPEGEERIRARHERLLRMQAEGTALPRTIHVGGIGGAVGGVVAWETDEWGGPVLEAAWAVSTRHQGRGWARRAVRLLLQEAAERSDRDEVVAVPGVGNPGSNALARSTGFRFIGPVEIEYPKGVPFSANEWRFDLRSLRAGRRPD